MNDPTRPIVQRAALDAQALNEIHHLWDELADFGVTQSVQAAARLMAFLCERVGAWNATWAGSVRLDGTSDGDVLRGWRVGAVQALHTIAMHANETKKILRSWDRREIDPSFLLPMQDVGAFRTYSFRRELPEAWFDGAFYRRHYAAVGTSDAVFVGFPLNEDSESHFGFYTSQAFTDADIALLAYALRGIKWFHRHLLLSHGLLMASSPLTSAERRVLHLLLTDAPEKHIARQADMTPSTVHQYVVSIYRKFGVRSRAGLMSLWLSHGG